MKTPYQIALDQFESFHSEALRIAEGYDNIPGATSSELRQEARLASLAADEVQEAVKFSSREKLAVCKVVEGAVELSPGRSQRVTLLEVVG